MFLILIEKFDQKSNFHPRLAWTRPYKSRMGPNREKAGSQNLVVLLHNFYEQILLINLISSLNWEVWLKVKLSAQLALNRTQTRKSVIFKSHE